MLVISIPQEFCSSETQARVVPHTVQALSTSRGRVWQGNGTCLFYINRCLGDSSLVPDCWGAYSLCVCTCAHGFLVDSKLRGHLAGMNTSHSGKSTAGKKDVNIFSLVVLTFPFSPSEASVPSSIVLLRRYSKKRKEGIMFGGREFVYHIPVWLL